MRALKAAGGFFVGILAFVARIILLGIRGLLNLMHRSRVFAVVLLLAVVVAVGGAVDTALNWGKIYGGVHIGTVDVGGKTPEEARVLLEETYADRLNDASVIVFANEEAAQSLRAIEDQAAADELAEQLSLEEARDSKQLWLVSSIDLSATLPAEDLAAQALAVGRDNGGVGARLLMLFGGWDITPLVECDDHQLEVLASEMDVTIGNPRVDYDIAISEGVAEVTEGHDGNMVNRAWLREQLSAAMLSENSSHASFVAQTEYAPLRITAEDAQRTCNAVNHALGASASVAYNGVSWEVPAEVLGAWTNTRIEGEGDTWALNPYINADHARSELLTKALEVSTGTSVSVTFTVDNDVPYVHTSEAATIPLTAEAVANLDTALYGAFREGGDTGEQGPHIEIATGTAPQTVTLDEALSMGIVGTISTYTTEFVSSAANENRNHNIRLGASLLNNSIAQANGGVWSFLETTGEFTAEKGFLEAGVIEEGEFSQDLGGGICQVATTVFLAVYDSGFPVVNRHAHSLRMASYPDGRDAAVAWDFLDLKWENDSSSDVLMVTSSTETSVTVTLYGVNPGYQVSTQVGEWQEGDAYEAIEKEDSTLKAGESYVKTKGKNGSSITVVRTVSDMAGNVLRTDSFYSEYKPVNEVVMKGPEPEE